MLPKNNKRMILTTAATIYDNFGSDLTETEVVKMVESLTGYTIIDGTEDHRLCIAGYNTDDLVAAIAFWTN